MPPTPKSQPKEEAATETETDATTGAEIPVQQDTSTQYRFIGLHATTAHVSGTLRVPVGPGDYIVLAGSDLADIDNVYLAANVIDATGIIP